MNKQFFSKFLITLQYIGIYIISYVMILFSTAKLFNVQFNVYNFAGYKPLNETPLFTHAWSFFGRSYVYNAFLGIIELVIGIFILFKRTRLLALLMAVGVYVNVLIIDFEFEVKSAQMHAMIEFLIVLLLLIPYYKSIWKFFWSMSGSFSTNHLTNNKKWYVFIPVIFLIIVITATVLELKQILANDDTLKGSYTVNNLIVNNDTLELKGGKYTKKPMMFLEFGNVFILSVNDSTYWADYTREGNKFSVKLDKNFNNIKSFMGTIDTSKNLINATTNDSSKMQLNFTRIKK